MDTTEEQTDCFRAIADPTRRKALKFLARRELTVSDLAQRFTISQPAISQHLAVLRSAGLVRERKQGRFRYYRADPAGLRPLVTWITEYEKFWRDKLSKLESVLDRMK